MDALGNVTVDPHSYCQPSKQLKILEILNLDTGEYTKTRPFISGYKYEDIIPLRGEIRSRWKSDTPKFACSICGVSVSLLAHTDKSWFFRHAVEDGSCPAETKATLTHDEITARKFHGLKESEPHKRVKAFVTSSLRADDSFSDVVEETYVRSMFSKGRRKPDVQAKFGDQFLAFEVQLSTTFLDVVIARKEFYREIGAQLIWVLPNFDPTYRRLTDDDIIFNNNKNVFIVDADSVKSSLDSGQFQLWCWFRVPFLEHGVIKAKWDSRLVAFKDLKFDQENQQTFWFDYQDEIARLKDEENARNLAVAKRLEQAKANEDQNLRDDFENFFCGRKFDDPWFDDVSLQWEALRNRFSQRQIDLPIWPSDQAFQYLLGAIYSAKKGECVGWGFSNVVEVAHHLYVRYKHFLLYFGFAVACYCPPNQVKALNENKKWKAKSNRIKESLANRDPEFFPDDIFLTVVKFLFPEVGSKVGNFLNSSLNA